MLTGAFQRYDMNVVAYIAISLFSLLIINEFHDKTLVSPESLLMPKDFHLLAATLDLCKSNIKPVKQTYYRFPCNNFM